MSPQGGALGVLLGAASSETVLCCSPLAENLYWHREHGKINNYTQCSITYMQYMEPIEYAFYIKHCVFRKFISEIKGTKMIQCCLGWH